MKKFISFLCSSLFALALTACGEPKAPATMEVTIVEVTDSGLTVVETGQSAGHVMTVGTQKPALYDQNGNVISAAALRPGQQLEVGYDGSILATFPSQVSGCEYLKLTGQEFDVTDLQAELQSILPKAEPDPMPILQVECIGKKIACCVNAPRGTSSWVTDEEGICMDSPHPLDWPEERITSMDIPEGCKRIRLIFSREPDSFLIRRWDISCLGDSTAEEEALTPDEEYLLPVQAGIYEVTAEYPEGSLSWVFRIN